MCIRDRYQLTKSSYHFHPITNHATQMYICELGLSAVSRKVSAKKKLLTLLLLLQFERPMFLSLYISDAVIIYTDSSNRVTILKTL